jgi:hypothetical protein
VRPNVHRATGRYRLTPRRSVPPYRPIERAGDRDRLSTWQENRAGALPGYGPVTAPRAAAADPAVAGELVRQASAFFWRTPCPAGQTLEQLARSAAAQLKHAPFQLACMVRLFSRGGPVRVRCSYRKLFAERAGSDVDDCNETRRYFHGRHFAMTPPLALENHGALTPLIFLEQC